jgi:DNA topoisomerase III
MGKLLAEGRTDVLRGFVSNRTRRKFSAFLVRKPDGTTGFEFEPRPAKAAKSSKTARKTAAAVSEVPQEEAPRPAAKSRSAEGPATTRAATRAKAVKTAKPAKSAKSPTSAKAAKSPAKSAKRR